MQLMGIAALHPSYAVNRFVGERFALQLCAQSLTVL